MQKEVMTSKEDKRINWHTATFMALFHIGAVAALFMFSWQALVAAVVLWWISASLGVGMGFHRLLTHRGYKTPKLVEYFITVCGLLALEGGDPGRPGGVTHDLLAGQRLGVITYVITYEPGEMGPGTGASYGHQVEGRPVREFFGGFVLQRNHCEIAHRKGRYPFYHGRSGRLPAYPLRP